ncbi:MAG TPA: carbon-nitrogen hydrolase, partial [Acetobacteraceae bacterium]|nr:carbon-nitrogen hydrolase [Acetobacteraceae bacterium]
APWSATLDDNRGYAAAFGPVDRGFPDDGVLARGVMNQPGLVFADLDPQRIESVRQTGAVLNHADWPA